MPPGNVCILDSQIASVHSQVLFKAQLKVLASNDTIKTLILNLNKIGAICLSIPVMTTSCSRIKIFSNEAY